MTPPGFHYARRVEFAETDTAGIAHFSVYLRYIEEAEHAWWRHLGLRIAAPDGDVAFPRVSFTIDYLAPLRFEDTFDVHLAVGAVTPRSLRYHAEIWRASTVVARASYAVVCVARAPGVPRAVALPDDVRARLTPPASL